MKTAVSVGKGKLHINYISIEYICHRKKIQRCDGRSLGIT